MAFIEALFGRSFDFWLVVKIMFILAYLVYFLFALVVFRQMQLMAKTLEDAFSPVIGLVGYLLIFLAGFGLVAAFLFL